MAKNAKQQKAGQRSAAKSRKVAAEATGGEQPDETRQTVTQLPSKKTVMDLLKAAGEKKEADIDNTTDYAGKVKLAQQNHLHKDAFNVIKKLFKFTPEKLADWLEHFDHMLDVTGMEKKAESAPRFEGIGGPKDDPSKKGGTTEEFEEDPPRTGAGSQAPVH